MMNRTSEPQGAPIEPDETDRLLLLVAVFGLVLFCTILAFLVWAPHRLGVASIDSGGRCRVGPVCAVVARGDDLTPRLHRFTPAPVGAERPEHVASTRLAFALVPPRTTDHQRAS